MKIFIKKYNNDSEIFLKEILSNYYNITKYEIIKNQFGKKFLKNINLFFNISHSKDLIVLIIDTEAVGIDIEFHNHERRFEKLVDHYFFDNEKEEYKISNDKINYFYHIWTSREAYVKMLGTGIVGYFYNLPDEYNESVKSFRVKYQNDDYTLSYTLPMDCISENPKEYQIIYDLDLIMEEINE